jgi:sugar phosphate isomerase/epimerase
MIEGLGDHVGICMDVGHAEQADLDWIDELRTATSARKLLSLHIHDVNEAGKNHFVPGERRIDWDTFIAELDACNFQGGRILEISPPETDIIERLREAAVLKNEWERSRQRAIEPI